MLQNNILYTKLLLNQAKCIPGKTKVGVLYIENESFASTFQGLFLEINLDSEKLGKSYSARNVKLCTIISKIAEGIAGFSASNDVLGDAYE